MDVFETCQTINELLVAKEEVAARDELIKLLAQVSSEGATYTPLINRLIREVGLYPYLELSTSTWEDRLVHEVFKVNVGAREPVTLHREQSRLLNKLLTGQSIAVSAPTSFGKSFVIDSFIAIKEPANVVIIVPTIALADETRRRLQTKFGSAYKVITAPDQSLTGKNILIFPQERSIGYMDSLEQVDILIVDEFYKASKSFDKERSPSLIRSIMHFGAIANQRYFLAPNISELRESAFTKEMEFLHLDFNTVYLEKTDLSAAVAKDEQKKSSALKRILSENPGKTLIYAGTYANIDRLSTLFIDSYKPLRRSLLNQFQSWLAVNYDPNWTLTKLVGRGKGVHNGRLHRSLSQIQIKLFEEQHGLDQLISTSSIIEGVNTSAQNVVVWSNRNGNAKINDFTYKNIIGRGGRMFRHFVGKIFILEQAPTEESAQLELELPDELLGMTDTSEFELTGDQIEAIHSYETQMIQLVGRDNLDFFQSGGVFQSSNKDTILSIAKDIHGAQDSWRGLQYLNSDNPDHWDRHLWRLINLQKGAWRTQHSKYHAFVKQLFYNWNSTIPEQLESLGAIDIGIDKFFELERITTFSLSSLLSDVYTVYSRITQTDNVDLTPAISRLSHAFLPTIVYQLEEYGLPRMISRKVNTVGVIDLEDSERDIHDVLQLFQEIGFESLVGNVKEFDDFDRYILKYFYDGIT